VILVARPLPPGRDLAAELAGPPPGAPTLYWLGQAGFVLRARAGAPVLVVDAYLSDHLARKYSGQLFPHRRMMASPIPADGLPRVDLVLCSHAHSDHMDPGTLPVLARRHPRCRFVVPDAVREHALSLGLPPDRTVGARADATLDPYPGVRLHPVPAAHEELVLDAEGRSPFLGYVIKLDGWTVYHSGDCVPYPGLVDRLVGHRVDLALLPVNGRDAHRLRNGVPGNFHWREALEICVAAGIPEMVGHHIGMFEFNTLAPDALDAALAGNRTRVVWHRPRTDQRYELTGGGGRR
jgi:L-ascorbate metabolism protein UlaG (beta-lactamase superfamily)